MFPEPYRQQAIENYEKDYDGFNGQSLFYDAADALFHGFDWDKNPQNQGFDYWAKFQDKLWRNEITLTAPEEEVEATHICKYCGAETSQSDEECYAKLSETLEEAAEHYSKKSSSEAFQETHKKDFIAGAKWQAAQATPDYEAKTYTESDVLDMIEAFLKSDLSELEKHLLEPEMTEREFAKHALSFIKSKTESNETHNN